MPAGRIIEIGPGATIAAIGPKVAIGRTGGPLPAGWAGGGLALNQGETVVLRAARGRKFRTVSADRDGVVELRAIDPSHVRVTAVSTGRVRLTVVTVD